MQTHNIHLGPMTGRAMMTPIHHGGVEILRSHDPEHDAARWLLDSGTADPADVLQTWRGITPCMSGIVGHLAAWAVVETDKGGLRMRRWADIQAERMRLAALPRRSRAEGDYPPPGFVVGGDFLSRDADVSSEHEAPSLAPSHSDLCTDEAESLRLTPARSRQG